MDRCSSAYLLSNHWGGRGRESLSSRPTNLVYLVSSKISRDIFETLLQKKQKTKTSLAVVMHTFNSSTLEADGSPEFEASLVYRSSYRTARAT